jgi:hypothetical protein
MLRKMIFLMPLFCSFLLQGCISNDGSRIIEVTKDSETFGQYEKIEFDVRLKGEWEDPYVSSDVAMDMILKTPSGKVVEMPGFYVSGESGGVSSWAVRFMAQEAGDYEYHVRLKELGLVVGETGSDEFESVPSERKGILKKNNLWTFQYDNGDVFRGVGENISWEARANDDNKYLKELHESPRFNYEYLLTTLADNDGNFFRTWMIYWNLPVDWKVVHNSNRYENSDARFNETGIKRMDELVELSDSLGIHVMLALEAHGGYMGSDWERNTYNVKQGGPAETPEEFFRLKEARQMYKDKLRFMIARWGYSPAIGAFEFFNEVDNAMYNVPEEEHIPEDLIRDWHEEMSRYLKETDPFGHLITTSVSHRDVEGMNEIPTIDFNQKHIYRGTKTIPEVLRNYSSAHGKPYVIGEFGYEWDWNIDFYEIAEEKISDYKRGLWYGLFSPTPILPMSWWWEFFDEMEIRYYLGHVQKINELMLESGSGDFEEVSVRVNDSNVENYAVRCGDKHFVYLFNDEDVEQNVTIELPELKSSPESLEIYDCETGIFSEFSGKAEASTDGVLTQVILPQKTDRVLIFSIK